MRKQITILSIFTVMTMLVSGCWMHDDTANRNMPEGEHNKTTTYVDENGTKHTSKTMTDVDVDSEGNRRAVVKTKDSSDPKGLFNKSSTTTKSVDQDRNY